MILKNKIAVVFAGNGAIAGAVAKAFSEKGAMVYVTAKNLADAEHLVNEIKKNGGMAQAHPADALNEADIDTIFKKVIADFLKPLVTIVGSQFLTSRAAAKFMAATNSAGTILTLTSSLSRSKIPFMAGITAASTGIEGLTRCLAAEFGMKGIKVICMNPTGLGETRTIRETSVANAATIGIPVEVFGEELGKAYLLGRSPSLKDVGNIAAFLASDEGAVLNSHIVDVDFGSRSVI